MSSAQYRVYCEKKAELIAQRKVVAEQLNNCEEQLEQLRKEYAKSCDHPVRVSTFPVCDVCYRHIAREE